MLADFGAGAGETTYGWFENMFEESRQMNIDFTAVGVTTNEPGAVVSIIKWATELKRRVDYLVVLNAIEEEDTGFEYWHDEPAVQKFSDLCKPQVMATRPRIREFQSALRNCELTLDQVIEERTGTPFFEDPMQVVRARHYQRNLYSGFDQSSSLLLPRDLAPAETQKHHGHSETH